MEYIGTMTFSALRCLIGGFVILIMRMNPFLRKAILDEESVVVDQAATRRGGNPNRNSVVLCNEYTANRNSRYNCG